MTVFSGVSKSATPLPSRRYSGFMATPKSRPALSPELRSSAGMTRLLGRAREHRAADHDRVAPLGARGAPARCAAQTRSSAARSIDPASPDGRADADQRDVGGANRLGGVVGGAQATGRGRLGDRLRQARLEDRRLAVVDRATLRGLTSTPMTSWPRLARQPAETAPT